MAKIKVATVKAKPKTKKAVVRSRATIDAEKAKKRLKTGKAAKPKAARPVEVKGIPFKLKSLESQGMRALPESYLTKKGKTLRQLIRNTPRLFVNNAVDVEAHRTKKTKTKTGKPVVKGIMWTNDPFRPDRVRRYHETFIIGLDPNQDKPVHKHTKVIAQCSCENFTYYFEYANAYFGASYLLYSNGEAPAWTNPTLQYGLCKHLVALAKICMEKDL